jgi:hypothetical protein
MSSTAQQPLAARFVKGTDLFQGGGYVACVGITHGLNGAGSPAADHNFTDPDLSGHFFIAGYISGFARTKSRRVWCLPAIKE